MSAYDDFVALKNTGFTPPRGAGRCGWCGFHTTTQGHRDGCPQDTNRSSTLAPKSGAEQVELGVAEGAGNTTRPLTHRLDVTKKGAS